MPTPTESRRERIAAALKVAIAAIDAGASPTKYWYTPTKVLRVDVHDVRYLRALLPNDAPVDVLYLLMPGDNSPEEATTGEIRKRAEFWLLAAKKWQPPSTDPYALDVAPPIKETLQNRLIQDVETKVWEDVTLGGLAWNTEITDENYINVDDAFPWAAVEMRIQVSFDVRKDAP